MASAAFGSRSCVITVNLFDGWRRPLAPQGDVLLTVRDGNQHAVLDRKTVHASTIEIDNLQFFDNFGDNYTIVVSGDEYEQAGFTPVHVTPKTPGKVDVMLLRKNAGFDFSRARWDDLQQHYAPLANLLAAGATDEDGARTRYGDLVEKEPVLACFFNLATAMSQIFLPAKTPLDYIRELIWDGTMQQDRFFAWAERALVDQVVEAAQHGKFAPEVGTAIFHPGATRSYKQVQFGEANVQLTFYENDNATIGGVECIKVEPDIDYYKDPLAHALLEVAANGIAHSMTDPRQVYVLRWMAGRHAGVPNFNPPYGIA